MINHCKPYKCNIASVLSAVLVILLGALLSSAACEAKANGTPRIALLGDSMTWIGGDSCQNATGWSHFLKQSGLASAIDVYARSGATWTNTASTRRNPDHYSEVLHDDNVIYNQVIRLIERCDTCDATPDLIILFAGANDAWFANKRPGIFDSNTATPLIDSNAPEPGNHTGLASSITLVAETLHLRFPMATLLFITPLQMSKTDAESIFKVSDIIESTARELGWKTLRPDKETGITHMQEVKSPTFTYDGVHTNAAGAKILGEYIIHYLKNLSPPQLKTDSSKLITYR